MQLQPEDALFFGGFACVLGAFGFVFKDIILGDSGLFEQMSNPSDAKARAGENKRSEAVQGVPGLNLFGNVAWLPDLDFVEVYGDSRSVARQESAGGRLPSDVTAASTQAESLAEKQAETQDVVTEAETGSALVLAGLASSLSTAIEEEDYYKAAEIKAEMDAIKAMGAVTPSQSSQEPPTQSSRL